MLNVVLSYKSMAFAGVEILFSQQFTSMVMSRIAVSLYLLG
ncbi:hypothetical protein DFP78_11391 [Photobacterium lutimaris]|nr:hypothetical protein DFP78_11391 [Photobacterium lutimaris]